MQRFTGVYSATTLRHFLVSGTYMYTYRWVHAHNSKAQKRGFALYRLEGIDILDLQFVGCVCSLQFAGYSLQLAVVAGVTFTCCFCARAEAVRPCRNRLELWEERRHASCSLIHSCSTRCRVRRPHTSSLRPALFCALLGMF